MSAESTCLQVHRATVSHYALDLGALWHRAVKVTWAVGRLHSQFRGVFEALREPVPDPPGEQAVII